MTIKTVLIIEDEFEIRNTTQKILQMKGFKVVTATNGQEGLEKLKTIEHPCIILLDLMMPVMDGWAFLENRKKDPGISSVPVIVLSAAIDKRAKTLGILDFIKKPFSIRSLLTVVERYCT